MSRVLIFFLAFIFFACKSKKTPGEETRYSYEQFANSFKNASLPFQLSDTLLLKNKDTARAQGPFLSSFIAESNRNKIFGKGAKIKFVPLWKMSTPEGDQYFIIKGESKNKKAAFLAIFDKDQQLRASFPFLIPDNDASTTEVSNIDKSFSIIKSIYRKKPNQVMAEGKDVYVYDKETKKFVLVMTDPLDEKNIELVNPIDTLKKTHRLAGDYIKDKKNIVSVRDGRKSNLLTVFVHIEKGTDCIGEVKGDATITSATAAVYQQAGDPCVMQLNFNGSSVSLKELEGCGSKRGLDCLFEGSFTRKKAAVSKTAKGKKKASKN